MINDWKLSLRIGTAFAGSTRFLEATMHLEHVGNLMQAVRDSIVRAESSVADHGESRALTRVLAYLWSAHDELELLSRHRQPALIEGVEGVR
jgi:hypothetical protein